MENRRTKIRKLEDQSKRFNNQLIVFPERTENIVGRNILEK